jgi:hypothetical protein
MENFNKEITIGDKKLKKKLYMKDWRKRNPDKYLAKTECHVCGGTYQLSGKSNHYKTKKHLRAQQKFEEECENIKINSLIHKHKLEDILLADGWTELKNITASEPKNKNEV